MSAPSVSIVLPTHNGSQYLERAVQSCLEQTFTDLELIIVDDCSTDRTPQIIAEFAAQDSRIRPVRHEINRRLPGALNTGFAMSRGRYLTWTSDDNLYRPNAIETMVSALDEDQGVGLVYSAMTLIDNEDRPLCPDYCYSPDELPFTCSVAACFLYRREVYDSVGDYNEDLFLAEDWDYWIRVADKFRLRQLSNGLYYYRVHEG